MNRYFKFAAIWLLSVTAVTLTACNGTAPTAVPADQSPGYTAVMQTPALIQAYPSNSFTLIIPQPAGAAAYPAPIATSTAPVYTYRIINQFPHDPAAFTQGLVWLDGEFYEGTGLNGQSSLRRVNPETGEVLQQVDLSEQYFGEGIVLWEDKIIQITWQENTAFVYDRETFEQVGEFSYGTEGWGITHDGRQLIMSDGTNTLYFRDPETFAELGWVQVFDGEMPVARLNELEYIDGEVWANIWQTDRIARIDPESGQVTGWVDLSGLLDGVEITQPVDVLNGIAYDAENGRLFVTGKLWPALFEIEIVAGG
jgi:glutamine cyclotransferase